VVFSDPCAGDDTDDDDKLTVSDASGSVGVVDRACDALSSFLLSRKESSRVPTPQATPQSSCPSLPLPLAAPSLPFRWMHGWHLCLTSTVYERPCLELVRASACVGVSSVGS
jgi:hypothetical protein